MIELKAEGYQAEFRNFRSFGDKIPDGYKEVNMN